MKVISLSIDADTIDDHIRECVDILLEKGQDLYELWVLFTMMINYGVVYSDSTWNEVAGNLIQDIMENTDPDDPDIDSYFLSDDKVRDAVFTGMVSLARAIDPLINEIANVFEENNHHISDITGSWENNQPMVFFYGDPGPDPGQVYC